MQLLPDWLQSGYLRLMAPVAVWLARRGVSPNLLTVVGTAFWILGGAMYGAGEIHWGGWLLGVTALFDVVDGEVARATGRATTFGAFLDSTLDRVADGAVLGGLAYFYATNADHSSRVMLVVCISALVGTLMVSYTRARAEGLGHAGKIGFMQRPERVVLLSAPQAFFGLALDGMVLASIIIFLAVTSWWTVAQRIVAVRRASEFEQGGKNGGREPAPLSEQGAPLALHEVAGEP